MNAPSTTPPQADHDPDRDRDAWTARSRRANTDLDRVRHLARTHAGDPDWAEVDALLARLGLALGRDHGFPGAPR